MSPLWKVFVRWMASRWAGKRFTAVHKGWTAVKRGWGGYWYLQYQKTWIRRSTQNAAASLHFLFSTSVLWLNMWWCTVRFASLECHRQQRREKKPFLGQNGKYTHPPKAKVLMHLNISGLSHTDVCWLHNSLRNWQWTKSHKVTPKPTLSVIFVLKLCKITVNNNNNKKLYTYTVKMLSTYFSGHTSIHSFQNCIYWTWQKGGLAIVFLWNKFECCGINLGRNFIMRKTMCVLRLHQMRTADLDNWHDVGWIC